MFEQLFHISSMGVTEVPNKSNPINKDLKKILDEHLESFLGMRFITSDYSTGTKHKGRIDKLGLDENNCPVIVQLRHDDTESIMTQGIDMVKWMISSQHRVDTLVTKKWGAKTASTIAWRHPRLICIAEDFYDGDILEMTNTHTQEGKYTVDFFRYNLYGTNNLTIEWFDHKVRTRLGPPVKGNTFFIPYPGKPTELPQSSKTQSARTTLEKCSDELQDCFQVMHDYLYKLSSMIELCTFDLFFAFKHIKNFVRIVAEPQTNTLWVYVKLNPHTVSLEAGFTRDVTTQSHLATGLLEIIVRSQADLERAKPLLLRAYQQS